MADKKKTITFEYRLSNQYTVYPITGAFGGITPRGDIIVNLFTERNAIPHKQVFELSNEHGLARMLSEEKGTEIVRDVHFGISLQSQDARSIADWLYEKAAEWDELVLKKVKQLDG
jgi:hypothetical protein